MQQVSRAVNTHQRLQAVQPIWKALEPQVCRDCFGVCVSDLCPNTVKQRFSGLMYLNNPCNTACTMGCTVG